MIRSFQASFSDASECSNYRSEKNVENIQFNGREREEVFKEDPERNATICLPNGFCRNRETTVDPLPCCKQRVQEQIC